MTRLRRLERALATHFRLGPILAWGLREEALYGRLPHVRVLERERIDEALERRGLLPVPPKVEAAYRAAVKHDHAARRARRP